MKLVLILAILAAFTLGFLVPCCEPPAPPRPAGESGCLSGFGNF